MRAVSVLALAVLSLAPASVAVAGDVAGRWSAEFDTQVGVQKYTFELAVDGETLTGKASYERMGETGEAELRDGKVSGDTVSFTEMLDFQGNQIPITYEGKLDGNSIAFKRRVGDFAEETFTATRVEDSSQD